MSTLGRLDEEFASSYLLNHTKLNMQDLARLKNSDPLAIRHILGFILQVPMSAKLPQPLLNKLVCKGTFDRRVADMGNRGRNWTSAFLNSDGSFNWQNGSFSLKFGEVRATHITHNPTNTTKALPDYAHITKAYELVDNYDDYAASAVLMGSRHELHNFFDENEGPHTQPAWHPRTNNLGDIAKAIALEVEAKKRAVETNTSSTSLDDALKSSTTNTKKEAAKKARAAMLSRQDKLKRQRRVALT